ncbi:MAG TPA: sulfatase-like hydrolase/transferase [bacterium]|nr:sulfatase-like hydrolase/transferase [bacterium]
MTIQKLSRRTFLTTTASMGAAVAASGCAGLRRSQAARRRQPNILFVFADQMRAQEMGCAGHPTVRTPRLDRMASEGVRFVNAVSACPVCTPYRAALLSGCYPLTTGMFLNDLRMPTNIPTVGTVLRDEGYHMGYIGKWHLDGTNRGVFTPPGPRRQGFDDFWAVANCTHDYMKAYLYRDTPEPIWLNGYEPDVQTDIAMEFLDAAPPDRPFCLFVSYGTPHNPYELMPEEYKIYRPEDIQPRPNCPKPSLKDIAGYCSHITALDRNMGRLLDAIDQRGLAEDTLVVFTSDHGDMLGSHGQQRKQRPWDESICVPFLIRQPGHVPAGIKSEAIINTPDIMPTLLSLCGAEIPPHVQGEDLSKVWTGHSRNAPTSALTACYVAFSEGKNFPEWRCVRTNRHSLVRNRLGSWMLFDNREDPYQMNNLIESPGHSEIRSRLEKDLERWLERTGDTFEDPFYYIDTFGYPVDKETKHIPYYVEYGKSD